MIIKKYEEGNYFSFLHKQCGIISDTGKLLYNTYMDGLTDNKAGFKHLESSAADTFAGMQGRLQCENFSDFMSEDLGALSRMLTELEMKILNIPRLCSIYGVRNPDSGMIKLAEELDCCTSLLSEHIISFLIEGNFDFESADRCIEKCNNASEVSASNINSLFKRSKSTIDTLICKDITEEFMLCYQKISAVIDFTVVMCLKMA